jgi:hypothetical protein
MILLDKNVILEPQRRDSLHDNLEKRLLPMFANRVLSFDMACTKAYAELLAKCRAAGLAVETADAFIAAVALANGFAERGGKPWEKGWIESTFNQLWNMLGAMKGYKGSNQRLNAPASLDEAIRYTKALIGQGERGALNLPPEAIAREGVAVLDAFGRPQRADGGWDGHIFNLGHGISQFTPPDHVTALVQAVHEHSRTLR